MKTLLLISVLMMMVSCTTNTRKTASSDNGDRSIRSAAGPQHWR